MPKGTQQPTDSSQDDTGQVHTVRQDVIDLLAKRLVKRINEFSKGPISQAKESLPSTTEDIRKLPFYNSTLEAIQYQRDNYLVGPAYAARRQRSRQHGIPSPPLNRIPFEAKALGNEQIVDLGAWFIPSPTVQEALLPIVVSLPSGVLKESITDVVANAIPLAQPLLDSAVKSSVLEFMDDPQWRQVIKNRAGGYMSSREDSTATAGGGNPDV